MFHGETKQNLNMGESGEGLAAEYLQKIGHRILGKNIRQKFGEIDIISADKNGTIHFVEVKALSSRSSLEPEDHLTASKLFKMKKMADWYANQNPKTVKKNYQLDLVAIKIGTEEGDVQIRFYENIS